MLKLERMNKDIALKLLHTSDWHLGRSLYGRKRYEEFAQFLDWIVQTVRERNIDVLVVAGDVFDTATPSNRAQALYYQFLQQMVMSDCRHVIVVAGNHDSPTFLNAPGDLLRALDVHVVGHACDDLSDQLVVLRDEHRQPQMIVCAVPYLRDRDVRAASVGETMQDKERHLIDGIGQHYLKMAELVQIARREQGLKVPAVATGHLYATGGQTIDGDGVRDLYIGSLGQVHATVFSDVFDYIALGHLHVPQIVGGQNRIRYSGSPIAMGFGEAGQQKVVCEVSFWPSKSDDRDWQLSVETIDVPVFQRLSQIRGDLATIRARLDSLKREGNSIWVEVLYESADVMTDLREIIEKEVSGTSIEILRIKLTGRNSSAITQLREEESLEDLTPMDVFDRCLESHQVSQAQRPALRDTYRELLTLMDTQKASLGGAS